MRGNFQHKVSQPGLGHVLSDRLLGLRRRVGLPGWVVPVARRHLRGRRYIPERGAAAGVGSIAVVLRSHSAHRGPDVFQVDFAKNVAFVELHRFRRRLSVGTRGHARTKLYRVPTAARGLRIFGKPSPTLSFRP